MGTIDELAKQLPYGDGAWRRRFISGIIFFANFAVYKAVIYMKLETAEKEATLLHYLVSHQDTTIKFLSGTQLLIVITLLIFAIGSLIEAIASGFIVRGVSWKWNFWIWDKFKECKDELKACMGKLKESKNIKDMLLLIR